MDMALKDRFLERWAQYFPGAELPLTFYYTDDASRGESVPPAKGHRCVIALLGLARKGRVLRLDAEAAACGGGKRYLGFSKEIMPDFDYFLSCGIPGKLEGERYKKSPEIVRQVMAEIPTFKAPGPYIVFKRWDLLEKDDEPEVVFFLAQPDILSGLFTLAGFDETEPQAVVAPFGAGCASIVQYPHLESKAARPRAVLGMFDVSARPCVPSGTLSFAAPMAKFARMVDDMDESFLITPSWEQVKKRFE